MVLKRALRQFRASLTSDVVHAEHYVRTPGFHR